MNCHEVQSKIAQIDGDSPAVEIIVHARECGACHQRLKEVLWQQKWLRERFAEASEQLLAHAPPLWGAAFQERLRGPALPAPLLPLAWAAVLLAVAALGWWTWTSSLTGSSKSSVAERHAPRESAERPTAVGANHRANSKPISSLSELESLGSVPESSWPAETEPMRTLSERHAVPQPLPESAVVQSLTNPDLSESSAESAAAESSPEVAVSDPPPPAKFRLDTGVFKMEPTALAPGAQGYLAAIIPNNATDQATAMVALSLTGLPTESAFYIRTRDVGGNQIWLGSGKTDTKGSAVAVLLRGSPTAASGPATVTSGPALAADGRATLPAVSTEPPVTVNFDGATGEDLVVVDTGGNVLMTVGAPTKPPVENRVNPSPTP